jgi:general secretion pathway protein A
MILRSYLQTVEKKHQKIIYVFNANLTFEGLLKTIYQNLGLEIESGDIAGMLNRLYEILIEEYRLGNTVVLVIDEAQNMPIDTLENLRMISNLETSKDKLIQVVLIGQPEFEEELNLDRLRQLNQRVAIRSTILPLTKEESLEYIKFRLYKAGSNYSSIFTAPALKKIIKRANGIPRLLNVLCDNALITAFGYQQKPVSKQIAKEIIRDFKKPGRSRAVPRLLFVALGLIVVVSLLIGVVRIPRQRGPFYSKAGMPMHGEQKKQPVLGANQERPVEKAVAHDYQVQPTPITRRERPSPAGNGDTSRTVSKGDTLSRLIRDVYGPGRKESEVKKLLELVRLKNQDIKNTNVIVPGQTITFPDASQKLPEN